MKVALFNVKYSPNLGDGLLSECLEKELARHGIAACSIDLAGREAFSAGMAHRGSIIRLLERMPGSLRRFITRTILSLLVTARLRPFFRAHLAGCEAVVLGGGNLFSDHDLNFPIKIHAALRQVAHRPVAVFGVGVSGGWSAAGRRLFQRGIGGVRLAGAAVRDTHSQAIWDHELGTIVQSAVVWDPGLLASRHYPAGTREPGAGRVAGLCITDPIALHYHGGQAVTALDMARWYGGLVTAMSADGWRVRLFTNGSPEDRAFLNHHLANWLAGAVGDVARVADFRDPGDLIAFVSTCDVLVAHRMHACIAAYSFHVPVVMLRWDRKLESFAERTGRTAFLADSRSMSPATVARLAFLAAAEGIDEDTCLGIIGGAVADVEQLAFRLRAAIQGRA